MNSSVTLLSLLSSSMQKDTHFLSFSMSSLRTCGPGNTTEGHPPIRMQRNFSSHENSKDSRKFPRARLTQENRNPESKKLEDIKQKQMVRICPNNQSFYSSPPNSCRRSGGSSKLKVFTAVQQPTSSYVPPTFPLLALAAALI